MTKLPPIPIGVDDFKEIIDRGSVYVDKTLLIKEFWEDGSKIVLTPRPRRFGKTLNLSMLKYFFERTEQSNSYLFEKTNIWKDPKYRELQGKFPVISITLKDVKKRNWGDAYKQIIELLSKEVKRTLSPLYNSLGADQQKRYHALVDRTADSVDYCNSLLFMTEILEAYYKTKTIVLIDEYDTPIVAAYLNDYYSDMVSFIRDLFSAVLKTNPALNRAFLTGITRTAKEGIFSGLNNLAVCSVLNEKYSDKFGFTDKEVGSLIAQYNLKEQQEDIRSWYNGYTFGKTQAYNPWSVLNCIDSKGMLKPYWVNTSDNELVARVIAQADDETKNELMLLLEGKPITKKKIDEGVVLPDLDTEDQEPWSFLLFTGYLTAIDCVVKNDLYLYSLAIPNKEILVLYKDLVLKAIGKVFSFAKLKKLFEALITGDVTNVTTLLQGYIDSMCSFHDLPQDNMERSVHMFVLGLLAELSYRYIIQSNRESGDGRYDIMLMPRDHNDFGILLEFKKTKSKTKAVLAAAADKALQQIKTHNYKKQLRDFGYKGKIICYGISACGKHIALKMGTIGAL